METKRQLHVLDTHLAANEYLAGDIYTIADMAAWPWYGGLFTGIYNAGTFLSLDEYPNVARWEQLVGRREAVRRGRIVNRASGEPGTFLRERHDAADAGLAL
jgi:GST-like protein